ncbi:MAG: tryptophan synthase subunit alpha [Solirubrobacterales bacterium]
MTKTGPATGATRIEAAFEVARAEGRAALMPYMMGGFPDRDSSARIAHAYVDGGADLIEMGVPFSDPLADGPVIHEAATAALNSGVRLGTVLDVCREVSPRVPVVLMAYTNMILGGDGPAGFAAKAREAGASGVIVPDLPLGEDEDARRILGEAGLAVIPLLAPTTLDRRREEICSVASGFVYVVSDVGTTGERGALPAHLRELVEDVRAKADVPVAVGFGIGSAEQAGEVGKTADGVIIGSRLVRMVADAESTDEAVSSVTAFLAGTREALTGGQSPAVM